MRVKDIFLSEKDLPRIDLVGIISHVLALSTENLLASPERLLDESQENSIRRLIDERRGGKPFAYLTHRREFFSEAFYVDERVLIPRPETELLVEEAIKIVRSRQRPVVLDMGTGSGVIGIMLAKTGAGSVFCVDVSPDALEVARKNARAFGLEGKIRFLASDLFSAIRPGRRFDLICANLPYVALHEWEGLEAGVREFEPKTALVGGIKGMELYERCLAKIGAYLGEDGALLCEIGGDGQAELMAALLQRAGFETTALADLAGRQRVIRAHGKVRH